MAALSALRQIDLGELFMQASEIIERRFVWQVPREIP